MLIWVGKLGGVLNNPDLMLVIRLEQIGNIKYDIRNKELYYIYCLRIISIVT